MLRLICILVCACVSAQGTMTFTNGDTFEGSYQAGKRHGMYLHVCDVEKKKVCVCLVLTVSCSD